MADPPPPAPIDALLAQRAWVRALARRLVADADAADEVEQRVWLAAVERPPAHVASPRGWLAAALRNAASKLGRAESRRLRHETAARVRGPERSADEVVAETELQQLIARLVLDLDEPYRATLLLRYVDGLEPAEIARRQGVPPETVRTRIHRGIARLRERLDESHRGGRRAWTSAVVVFAGDGPGAPPRAMPPGAALAGAVSAGGMVMTAMQKAVAAAAMLALLAFGGIALRDGLRAGDGGATTDPGGVADVRADRQGTARAARAARPGDDGGSAPAAPGDLDAIDFDEADRERDVAGVVVRRDGAPVAGAEVTAIFHRRRLTDFLDASWHAEETLGPATRTAADGSFRLRLARGDMVSLRVVATDFADRTFTNRAAGGRVRLVLDDGVRLRMTAVAPDGTPVAGVRLRLRVAEVTTAGGASREATTDARGIAIADGLPAGATAWIETVGGEHGQMWFWDVKLPESGEGDRRLEFLPHRTLRGRITDADARTPVAGARVGMNWMLDHAVTSRADGSYELAGWTGLGAQEIHVVAPGYARAEVPVGGETTLDVALHRGFAARGRVVGADGAPVAGALVAAIASVFESAGQRTSMGHAVAGADGTFRVDGLDPRMPHVLVVAARGHARARPDVPSAAAGAETDLGDVRLGPPHALAGRVLDASGAGVEGARVDLFGPLPSGAFPNTANLYGLRASRRTDDLGRFRFDDLPPGRYALDATPTGAPGAAAQTTIPEIGDRTDAEIRLSASRTLTVRVVDDSGRPVAGAVVEARGESAQAPRAVTGDDGTALVQATAAISHVEVTPRRDGERALVANEGTTPIPHGASEMTVVVPAGARLRVRVLGPDGTPIARATVVVTPGPGPLHAWKNVWTDEQGRATVVMAKAPSYDVRFHGQVSGRDAGFVARALGVAAGAEITLRAEPVTPDRTVRARVVRPDGTPAAGVHVWLSPMSGDPSTAGVTDADGVAAFDGVPARDFTFTAAPPKGFAAPAQIPVIPAGQTVELRLRAATSLRGRVLDADGRGARAVVSLDTDGVPVAAVATDAEGAFSFDVAADEATTYTLTARTAGDAPRESPPATASVPGADEIVLRLVR